MRPILGRANTNGQHETLRGGRSPSPVKDVMSAFPPPTIRLVSGNPITYGSTVGNDTFGSIQPDSSFASSYVNVSPASSPLAPRRDEARRKLVPKKSKLGMLSGTTKTKERGRDMSDMVRRVGGGTNSNRGGFEIYVDPAPEAETGEVLMVQKKKSRGALNALGWGGNSNAPSTGLSDATNTAGLKPKSDAKDKDKWWSIGRGKKVTKDKENPGKAAESVMFSVRSKCKSYFPLGIPDQANRK